jgi:hypothetical protein
VNELLQGILRNCPNGDQVVAQTSAAQGKALERLRDVHLGHELGSDEQISQS